jgi:peptidoglycan-associated lipoprotein
VRGFACLLLAAALAACTPDRQALFVVLPNPDGSAGAVTIEEGNQSVLLDHAYAAGEVRGTTAAPVALQSAQVNQIFGQAIGARPILPTHFRLYFISDSTDLTAASVRLYRSVFDDIKHRPVYQVQVIGHTDTLGEGSYNLQLSLRRARAIRDHLIKDGIAATAVSVAGRGDRDLAVPEPPNTSQPLNRRVEITVQ